MRYLAVYRTPETGKPPTEQEMTDVGRLIQDMTNAGVLLATEGCQPTAKGFRVRRIGESITVKDGPFTEAKEVIGGFAIFQVKSKEEAVEWTKRFLRVAGDGESEVRLIHEMP